MMTSFNSAAVIGRSLAGAELVPEAPRHSAGIGKDFEYERPQGMRSLIKHHPIAVLNVGEMNGDAQQQAERYVKSLS